VLAFAAASADRRAGVDLGMELKPTPIPAGLPGVSEDFVFSSRRIRG